MQAHNDAVSVAALRAENEALKAALIRVRTGFYNILELRRMQNGRYGNLTEEEVREVIGQIDAALSATTGGKEARGAESN